MLMVLHFLQKAALLLKWCITMAGPQIRMGVWMKKMQSCGAKDYQTVL